MYDTDVSYYETKIIELEDKCSLLEYELQQLLSQLPITEQVLALLVEVITECDTGCNKFCSRYLNTEKEATALAGELDKLGFKTEVMTAKRPSGLVVSRVCLNW